MAMTSKSLLMCPYVVVAASRARFSPIFKSVKPYSAIVAVVSQSPKLVSNIGESNIRNGKCVQRQSLHDGFIAKSVGGGRRFTSRATVNEPGSISSALMQSMENKIKEQLNTELVSVKDASGDGRHVYIDVVSAEFDGKSAVNRQRMVYKAIWEELQNTVHAVDQMTTRTPTEAAADK